MAMCGAEHQPKTNPGLERHTRLLRGGILCGKIASAESTRKLRHTVLKAREVSFVNTGLTARAYRPDHRRTRKAAWGDIQVLPCYIMLIDP